MPTFRQQAPVSVLTSGALLLILCGLALAMHDVQWQLVSMASFHAGVILTVVALCVHVWQRHPAWRIELLTLSMLGILLALAPVMPSTFQGCLEALIP